MAIKGNKGEWSEIYAFIKILGDGKLYAGDGDLNKIEELFYPIIKILRVENEVSYQYIIDGDIIIISGETDKLQIPISVFRDQAVSLLEFIKKSTGSSFSLPLIEEFMDSVKCQTLKAKTLDKTDIRIVIHDLRTNMTPTLGFSIKSKLGNPSTLLNASQSTNSIFEITDIELNTKQIEQINAINTRTKIIDRINAIKNEGASFDFTRNHSSVYHNNLVLIDSMMPHIVSEMLKLFYIEGISLVKDMAYILQERNPLKYDISNSHQFYEYKIKRLLTDVALGMTPTNIWTGTYDANGGYIVVREDGEVLCYHIYNKNDFEDYLINNTKLETASSKRNKFGSIESVNDRYFIRFNLQIRFI